MTLSTEPLRRTIELIDLQMGEITEMQYEEFVFANRLRTNPRLKILKCRKECKVLREHVMSLSELISERKQALLTATLDDSLVSQRKSRIRERLDEEFNKKMENEQEMELLSANLDQREGELECLIKNKEELAQKIKENREKSEEMQRFIKMVKSNQHPEGTRLKTLACAPENLASIIASIRANRRINENELERLYLESEYTNKSILRLRNSMMFEKERERHLIDSISKLSKIRSPFDEILRSLKQSLYQQHACKCEEWSEIEERALEDSKNKQEEIQVVSLIAVEKQALEYTKNVYKERLDQAIRTQNHRSRRRFANFD